jgi:hypothetical protein
MRQRSAFSPNELFRVGGHAQWINIFFNEGATRSSIHATSNINYIQSLNPAIFSSLLFVCIVSADPFQTGNELPTTKSPLAQPTSEYAAPARRTESEADLHVLLVSCNECAYNALIFEAIHSLEGVPTMVRNAVLGFIALALIGFVGWIAVRFTKPILGVSHDGFLILTLISLGFVIALSLIELVFQAKKS